MVRPPGVRGTRLLPSDRRGQLLAAARHLLERGTIDDVRIETVAAEAGVSPGLLFHYFGSQRGFRHAVLRAAAEELLDHLRPDPSLAPGEQLRAGVETFVEYVCRHPDVYLAITRLDGGSDMRTLHRSTRATLAGWLTEGLTTAGAPATPALTMAVAGWLAYMEEVVLTWLDQPAMDRADLVNLCERTCYQIVMAALNDSEQYERLTDRVRGRG
ncbi:MULTISPECIES: TetR/AcrR family transcriptional regulator [Protofrankia]|uniref:Regulatory protein TetR n=1 Tax=Candidatus Protofrankia datiscae TaxID=2716812 RepID=F8AWK6_9ACTN|nr:MULTISPECIES: TetR/AcrR family transcriptional regulator [Protofrankia]AEH09343.1 regulatory protein TetR [Candidatus Protofrankia datiscae]